MLSTCCFTGYRPHRFAFSPDGLRPQQVQQALGMQIARLYEDGYRTFITGMCAGVDLWAAEEVLALRLRHPDARLVAAIPFEGQESRWPSAVRQQYKRVLQACDRVEVLFDAQAAAEDPAACYRQRNRWMVDQSSAVISVYELGAPEVRSGTAATVRYARRLQRRVVYIHPVTLDVTEETVQQMQFSL